MPRRSVRRRIRRRLAELSRHDEILAVRQIRCWYTLQWWRFRRCSGRRFSGLRVLRAGSRSLVVPLENPGGSDRQHDEDEEYRIHRSIDAALLRRVFFWPDQDRWLLGFELAMLSRERAVFRLWFVPIVLGFVSIELGFVPIELRFMPTQLRFVPIKLGFVPFKLGFVLIKLGFPIKLGFGLLGFVFASLGPEAIIEPRLLARSSVLLGAEMQFGIKLLVPTEVLVSLER